MAKEVVEEGPPNRVLVNAGDEEEEPDDERKLDDEDEGEREGELR